MAQFKVGDRVRYVNTILNPMVPTGTEGVVVGIDPWVRDPVRVDFAGSDRTWSVYVHSIAPLTPPAEDAWASEQVRKVTKPQHVEPVAPERPCVVETDALDMERALDRAMREIGLNGH